MYRKQMTIIFQLSKAAVVRNTYPPLSPIPITRANVSPSRIPTISIKFFLTLSVRLCFGHLCIGFQFRYFSVNDRLV